MRYSQLAGWLSAGLIATSLQAQQPAPPAVISTSGTGTVTIAADMAVLSIGVDVQAASPAAAREDMDRRIAGVMDALAAIGFPRDSLPTTGYVVQPVYDYQHDRRITGYAASTSFEISVHDLSMVAQVIVTALDAGGTTLGGLRFDATDREEARSEALTRAVRQARHDAETIARAAGGTLGGLVELSSDPSQPRYEMRAMTMDAARARGATPQVNPQDIAVSETVHARWRFVPGGP
jgi:uncharacterized protein